MKRFVPWRHLLEVFAWMIVAAVLIFVSSVVGGCALPATHDATVYYPAATQAADAATQGDTTGGRSSSSWTALSGCGRSANSAW